GEPGSDRWVWDHRLRSGPPRTEGHAGEAIVPRERRHSTADVRRRAALALVVLFLAPVAGEAQEARKTPRIGMLSNSPTDPFAKAFQQGLRELGYVEGRNIIVEYRWTEGRFDALPSLVAELVRLDVDIIVASSQAAVAARQATSTIPIVMPVITDPVRLGLVASLAKPGGNATGLATQNDELPGKWLAVGGDMVPKGSRRAGPRLPASYRGG